MALRTAPGSGFLLGELGDSNWDDEFNDTSRILSALSSSAKSRTTALPGTPSIGDIYIVPTGTPTTGDQLAIWDGPSGSEVWNYYTPVKGWSLWIDDEAKNYQWQGSAWVEFAGGGGGSGSYDIRYGFTSEPAINTAIDTVACPREITLAANLVPSSGAVGTNPASSYVMSLKDDGIEIGTVTISTGGVFTFATTGGTPQTVLAGSVLTLETPGTLDGTIADMACTIGGVA